MATGIIGVLAASSTLTYIPASDAKVGISGLNQSTIANISINGVALISMAANVYVAVTYVYVGANQSITITTPAATTAIISSLESA